MHIMYRYFRYLEQASFTKASLNRRNSYVSIVSHKSELSSATTVNQWLLKLDALSIIEV